MDGPPESTRGRGRIVGHYSGSGKPLHSQPLGSRHPLSRVQACGTDGSSTGAWSINSQPLSAARSIEAAVPKLIGFDAAKRRQLSTGRHAQHWIPAAAGMTDRGRVAAPERGGFRGYRTDR